MAFMHIDEKAIMSKSSISSVVSLQPFASLYLLIEGFRSQFFSLVAHAFQAIPTTAAFHHITEKGFVFYVQLSNMLFHCY